MSDLVGPQTVPNNPEAPRRRSGGNGSWIDPVPMRPWVKRLLMLLAVLVLLAIIGFVVLG